MDFSPVRKYSFLLDSCKLWAPAISCGEELHCLSLCLKKYFLLLIWNLLPLNLIWCPLLLSEGSCSPFQCQSRINKLVLHIPELSLSNWIISFYLVSTTTKNVLYWIILTCFFWVLLSSVPVLKDRKDKNFSLCNIPVKFFGLFSVFSCLPTGPFLTSL